MSSLNDTIAAIATPIGEGGLGVIRISGAQAISVADRMFISRRGTLAETPGYSALFGTLNAERPLDHAVAAVFRAPQSYTGEDVVELSLHGSPYLLQEALQLCFRNGARMALPGEFTQRAFLNGKMDLTQAEAVAELIHAKTQAAHAAALAQLDGHLSQRVRALRDQLVPLLAHIEVGLDHSDENHDFLAPPALVASCETVTRGLQDILNSASVGRLLREGFRITLLGRPNVGKSSVLNALLKEERAIVAPIAGTTRDTLDEWIHWDGIPVILTDTAGLRSDAKDPVERLGIERARRAIERSDFVIGLFDLSETLTAEDQAVVSAAGAKPHLWVANKKDLPARWTAETLAPLNGGAPVISVSAKTGEGLDALVHGVKNHALEGRASAAQAQWMLNARHREALERAQQALARSMEAARAEAFEECVALELRAALAALGEIIGETTTDDLLGQIFSTFCVGK